MKPALGMTAPLMDLAPELVAQEIRALYGLGGGLDVAATAPDFSVSEGP